MSDRVLLIAFAISIFGLLILAYVSESLEPPISRISGITSNDLGKNVNLEGIVSEFHRFQGGSILLTVSDSTGDIDVYLPYNIATGFPEENLKDKNVKVIGEVQVYNGKLEVIAEDVETR